MMRKYESPCIQICSLEIASGHCYGCGRNREEIGRWHEMPDEERNEITLELPNRLAKLPRRPKRVTKRAAMRKAKK